MKILIRLILTLFALTLMLSGCGKTDAVQNAPAAEVTAPADTAQEAAPSSVEAEQASSAALSQEELQFFTELFDTPEYNGFPEEPFSSTADISWDTVLRSGAGIAVKDPGENEISAFLKATGSKKLYGEIMAVRAGELEDFILKHTGADPKSASELLTWTYVPEYDSFYLEYWSIDHIAYKCISGEKTGDSYAIRLEVDDAGCSGITPRGHYGKFADRVLNIKNSGDGFIVVSNAILWDELSDREQSFDVELQQFDGPVRFITYSVDPDESSFIIVKDGKCIAQLLAWIDADTLTYLKKIAAVGFFDFNADGMDDICVIGDSDFGQRAILYEAVTDEYVFSYFTDLDENELALNGSGLTISGIRSALTGADGFAHTGSWQDAYAQIAKVYQMTRDRFRFDLIRADGDDIPELVISDPGYMTTLYTFENGRARCLMHQWPYGAGGNSGYSYVPEMGIYYNGNADYAGAIYYESYMSKHEQGELITDYCIKHINFNDLDGDGEPSYEELEASGEYEGISEYFNESGEEMTEAELREIIRLYEGYEKRSLYGESDYYALLSQLNSYHP
ncbi:MAG: hypothetical protein K5771_09610 [Oscillospiraceae bacterium]|nr:hypothetical protein [Oscillospiraceae bacterium]